MGQKVHPISFRLAVNRTWNSKWFSVQRYREFLREDVQIRKFLIRKLKGAGLSNIEIERSANNVTITIYTSKPGLVIGRGGAGSEGLRKDLSRQFVREPKVQLKLNIQEISRPELDASIVTQNVIEQIEKRLPFRRILKQTVEQVKRAGAPGVKVMVSGRLNGAEIARREYLAWGRLPLQTLRANIDFSRGTAHTTYGTIGVKVWIYQGDVFKNRPANSDEGGA